MLKEIGKQVLNSGFGLGEKQEIPDIVEPKTNQETYIGYAISGGVLLILALIVFLLLKNRKA